MNVCLCGQYECVCLYGQYVCVCLIECVMLIHRLMTYLYQYRLTLYD